MITISETTTPKFSYKKIIKHPLTKEVFINTITQLGIQDEVKEALIKEFSTIIEDFKDFSYTGDIQHFKVNLYTTLSEAPKNIKLIELLSTEEFVEESTKEINNKIAVSLADKSGDISLDEYMKTISKRAGRKNILARIRGLYSFNENHTEIEQNTSELTAALKKHAIINHNTNDSTGRLNSLVELSKQNESMTIKEESDYNTIKSYTSILSEENAFQEPDDYSNMIHKIKTILAYFSKNKDNKQDKLDKVMYIFLKKLTEQGLSEHKKRYGYVGREIFSIEYKEKININELIKLLANNNEYKEFVLNIMNEKTIKLQNRIGEQQREIENFDRPTRKERCEQAPYRGAPIKSDQEYKRELESTKRELDMNTKNLDLIKSYIGEIQKN